MDVPEAMTCDRRGEIIHRGNHYVVSILKAHAENRAASNGRRPDGALMDGVDLRRARHRPTPGSDRRRWAGKRVSVAIELGCARVNVFLAGDGTPTAIELGMARRSRACWNDGETRGATVSRGATVTRLWAAIRNNGAARQACHSGRAWRRMCRSTTARKPTWLASRRAGMSAAHTRSGAAIHRPTTPLTIRPPG